MPWAWIIITSIGGRSGGRTRVSCKYRNYQPNMFAYFVFYIYNLSSFYFSFHQHTLNDGFVGIWRLFTSEFVLLFLTITTIYVNYEMFYIIIWWVENELIIMNFKIELDGRWWISISLNYKARTMTSYWNIASFFLR